MMNMHKVYYVSFMLFSYDKIWLFFVLLLCKLDYASINGFNCDALCALIGMLGNYRLVIMVIWVVRCLVYLKSSIYGRTSCILKNITQAERILKLSSFFLIFWYFSLIIQLQETNFISSAGYWKEIWIFFNFRTSIQYAVL